jgi:hypothetical protein
MQQQCWCLLLHVALVQAQQSGRWAWRWSSAFVLGMWWQTVYEMGGKLFMQWGEDPVYVILFMYCLLVY